MGVQVNASSMLMNTGVAEEEKPVRAMRFLSLFVKLVEVDAFKWSW